MSTRSQASESEENKIPSSVPFRAPDDLLPAALDLWAQAGAQHWIAVEGYSMAPLLREGDAVLVTCGRDRVQRGTVVLFRQGGKLVAHRVWKITQGDGGPILVTKGDSLCTFDAPLPKEKIIGRVVAVERNGRQFRLDSPGWQAAGWLIAVATLCVAVPVRCGQALLRRMRIGQGSQRDK